MAHIVASSNDGPRGDANLSETAKNKYDNLILLCPNHHEEVDAELLRFDVKALAEMKHRHEAWVTTQLARGGEWHQDLSTVDYVNVPRLLLDPASTGLLEDMDRAYLGELTTLRELGFQIGTIAHVLGTVLASWSAYAVDLDALAELGSDAVGARISFEATFRTKNMTGSEKQRSGFELSGELRKDPHLYVKRGGRKIYLPLDPRWVTTSTAFVTFTSGIATLAGVGLLRGVNDQTAIISPLAIGSPPLSGFAKAFDEGLSV